MNEQEELRLRLAQYLEVSVSDVGGGLEYGQFWNGPDEHPYELVREKLGDKK